MSPPARPEVGTDGSVLVADSTQASGAKWVSPLLTTDGVLETQTPQPRKVVIEDLERFVSSHKVKDHELSPGDTLVPHFTDELSQVFHFEKAPKNAKELAGLLHRKYALFSREKETDLQACIEELEKLGFEVEPEHEFLINALNSVMTDGTVDVDDAVAAKMDAPKTEASWSAAGLIAAVGFGITTAVAAIKGSKEAKKQAKTNQTSKAATKPVEQQVEV